MSQALWFRVVGRVMRSAVGLGMLAACVLSDVSQADQARTACVLLNGGTIRILAPGLTNCNALEGAFQLVQPSKPTEKTLSANINANGTIDQQDTYTTAQGATANWLSSVILNADGTIRLNFASDVFTASPALKCAVTPTTDTVPPPQADRCGPPEDGGCPIPDRWVATTTNKSVAGITVNTRDALYKAQLCNYRPPKSLGYSCRPFGTRITEGIGGLLPYVPGNLPTVLPTQGGNAQRSSFSIVCTGF